MILQRCCLAVLLAALAPSAWAQSPETLFRERERAAIAGAPRLRSAKPTRPTLNATRNTKAESSRERRRSASNGVPRRPLRAAIAMPLAQPDTVEPFGPAIVAPPPVPPEPAASIAAVAPPASAARLEPKLPHEVPQVVPGRPTATRTTVAPVAPRPEPKVVAPTASIMPSAPPPAVDALARLAGDWNNDATGENASIRRSLFGWEIWLSNLGQASIVLAARRGANIEVSSRDVTCLYVATIVAGGKMNWQLREGPEGKCLAGSFSPAAIAPQ